MGSTAEDRVPGARQVGPIEVPGSGKQIVSPDATGAPTTGLRQQVLMESAAAGSLRDAQQPVRREVPGGGNQNVPPGITRATTDQGQRVEMKSAATRSIPDAYNSSPIELALRGILSNRPDAQQVSPMELPGNESPIQRPNAQLRHAISMPQFFQAQSQSFPTFKPFSISTDNDSLSSGFPYSPKLHDVRIDHDQWAQFTGEVLNAARITASEDAAAWAMGTSVGLISSPLLLVFAPMVGYAAGKSVHKKTVVKIVKEKLAEDGQLRSVLRRWNDGAFKDRGCRAWLEPPTESRNVIMDMPVNATPKAVRKEEKKNAKRFRIVIMPCDPRDLPVSSTGWSPLTQSSNGWSSNDQSPVTPSDANGNNMYGRLRGRNGPHEMPGGGIHSEIVELEAGFAELDGGPLPPDSQVSSQVGSFRRKEI